MEPFPLASRVKGYGARSISRRVSFAPRHLRRQLLPRQEVSLIGDRIMGVTVIIPAYNEAESVGDTIQSLLAQTVPPDQIILVDDGSTDGTGDVGRRAGITVIRPPHNTGSKAGAQTFALPWVRTRLVMAIDADTTLEPTAVERLMQSFAQRGVGAACGFVLPRRIESLWERGRFIEYLFAFTFYKQALGSASYPKRSATPLNRTTSASCAGSSTGGATASFRTSHCIGKVC